MLDQLDEILKAINNIPHPDEKECFRMGYDTIKHGANTTNCHFSLFSTPEKTKAWEAGVKFAKNEIGE